MCDGGYAGREDAGGAVLGTLGGKQLRRDTRWYPDATPRLGAFEHGQAVLGLGDHVAVGYDVYSAIFLLFSKEINGLLVAVFEGCGPGVQDVRIALGIGVRKSHRFPLFDDWKKNTASLQI